MYKSILRKYVLFERKSYITIDTEIKFCFLLYRIILLGFEMYSLFDDRQKPKEEGRSQAIALIRQ